MTLLRGVLLACLTVGMLSGCYRTHTVIPGSVLGPERTDRQWFSVAGLVQLSKPAEANCGESGLAEVQSETGVVDVLINVGLTLGGGILGAAAGCGEGSSDTDCSTAVSAGTTLVPFLLGTRTVRYRCNKSD